jgi:hypothetical protein
MPTVVENNFICFPNNATSEPIEQGMYEEEEALLVVGGPHSPPRTFTIATLHGAKQVPSYPLCSNTQLIAEMAINTASPVNCNKDALLWVLDSLLSGVGGGPGMDDSDEDEGEGEGDEVPTPGVIIELQPMASPSGLTG